MPVLNVEGKKYEVDIEGYLEDWTVWEEKIAIKMAKEDGINELSDEHWLVINFLRERFEKYRYSPNLKTLTFELKEKYGAEIGCTKYLYELYPNRPECQAARYAGLPKPGL